MYCLHGECFPTRPSVWRAGKQAHPLHTPVDYSNRKGTYLRKHDAWIQCWVNVGASSATLVQHLSTIVTMRRVSWDIFQLSTDCLPGLIYWHASLLY